MIKTVLSIVGWACLAFSIVGFVETWRGFRKEDTYNLLRAIVYSILFGIGMGLLK